MAVCVRMSVIVSVSVSDTQVASFCATIRIRIRILSATAHRLLLLLTWQCNKSLSCCAAIALAAKGDCQPYGTIRQTSAVRRRQLFPIIAYADD